MSIKKGTTRYRWMHWYFNSLKRTRLRNTCGSNQKDDYFSVRKNSFLFSLISVHCSFPTNYLHPHVIHSSKWPLPPLAFRRAVTNDRDVRQHQGRKKSDSSAFRSTATVVLVKWVGKGKLCFLNCLIMLQNQRQCVHNHAPKKAALCSMNFTFILVIFCWATPKSV